MKNKKLTIGISLRVVENTDYNEKRDALSHDLSQFFEKLGIWQHSQSVFVRSFDSLFSI